MTVNSELLMTYSEDKQPICLKERKQVHSDGDLHFSIQCWIADENQNVILQLRQPKKEGSPNKWDVSCGGHCSDGEPPEIGVLREAKEELDISILPKKLIFLTTSRHSSQEGKNQELIHIYLYKMNFNIDNINFQKEEISQLKFINIKELKKLYQQKESSLANRQGAMEALFKYYEI